MLKVPKLPDEQRSMSPDERMFASYKAKQHDKERKQNSVLKQRVKRVIDSVTKKDMQTQEKNK